MGYGGGLCRLSWWPSSLLELFQFLLEVVALVGMFRPIGLATVELRLQSLDLAECQGHLQSIGLVSDARRVSPVLLGHSFSRRDTCDSVSFVVVVVVP